MTVLILKFGFVAPYSKPVSVPHQAIRGPVGTMTNGTRRMKSFGCLRDKSSKPFNLMAKEPLVLDLAILR